MSETPLLALPTSCTGALETSVETDSWAQRGVFQTFDQNPMDPLPDGRPRLFPENRSQRLGPSKDQILGRKLLQRSPGGQIWWPLGAGSGDAAVFARL